MEVRELQVHVIINPTLEAVVPEVVTFETGASPEQVADSTKHAYDHHGQGFTSRSPGALQLFFEDLILGVPMPLTLGVHKIADVDTIIVAALFCKRDLAIHPAMPSVVYGAELFHRRGSSALAHIPQDLGRFFLLLKDFFPGGLGKDEVANRLMTAIGWLHDYLFQGRLPHLGALPTEVRVIDVGTNGFVLAESEKPTEAAWTELFRKGFLRGVMYGRESEDLRQVLAAKKSSYATFDLEKARMALNEIEYKVGGTPEWKCEGLFLKSPEGGSLILPSIVTKVLLHC